MIRIYEIFSGEELTVAEKILRRRLQILVHSCIYYELDHNIISDRQWDMWAKELKALQGDYPHISEQVPWYDAFKDWDASTGAFLPLKDDWVVRKAKQVIAVCNGKCVTSRGCGKTHAIQETATLLDIAPTPVRKATKQQTGMKRLF